MAEDMERLRRADELRYAQPPSSGAILEERDNLSRLKRGREVPTLPHVAPQRGQLLQLPGSFYTLDYDLRPQASRQAHHRASEHAVSGRTVKAVGKHFGHLDDVGWLPS